MPYSVHSRTRRVPSDLSKNLLEYWIREHGLTQERIADLLELSPSFISRVRGGERSFTTEYMSIMADAIGVPLGAMLLAATPKFDVKPKYQKLKQLCEEALRAGDEASALLEAELERRKKQKESGVTSR
jgi:transcriptional regulator with XRE-family HTH domain